MKAPSNTQDAVTLALFLALTAPTDQKARKAAALAESLAVNLSERDIKNCKRRALRQADEAFAKPLPSGSTMRRNHEQAHRIADR